MKLSCIQGRIFSKLMRVLFNNSSNIVSQRSTKISNTQNNSIHIVMRTIPGISLTDAESHLLVTSFTEPLSASVTGNRHTLFISVSALIQEQCIQMWWIKNVL